MANKKKKKEHGETAAPSIFQYHDYRQFLRDWIEFKRKCQPRFSLRRLAMEGNVALGLISMGLSGERKFSSETLAKLVKPLGLNTTEGNYLELLRTIAESDSQEVRLMALSRIQRFQGYQEKNPKEIEAYKYLTRWYYVAIREMAGMDGFRLDARWIQEQLQSKVPLHEIQGAIEFLVKNGYLEVAPDQKIKVPEKDINCTGGVYRVAIAQFHREMLSLASRSLEALPVGERMVIGHTMAIPRERYEEVKQILEEALRRIAEVGREIRKADSVYQVSLTAFPLTNQNKGSNQ